MSFSCLKPFIPLRIKSQILIQPIIAYTTWALPTSLNVEPATLFFSLSSILNDLLAAP